MEIMPEEIFFNILLWLPVISLLRFKTVCKSWLTLIESSTFVNQHLHHHSRDDALIISRSRGLDFYMFSGNKYEIYTDVDFDDRFCTTISPDGGIVGLIDSCDGIICLHNDWSGNVALWNPALKQLRILPKSSIPHQHYIAENYDVQFNTIGFGFDAKANDYKVVRIIWHYTRPEVNQIEVYSLRTSLSWRIVQKNEALPFTFLNKYSEHATSKDGTCFWLGGDNNGSLLVAFDLKSEAFKTMSLPDSCGSKPCGYALDFLNEKLVYIRGLKEDECSKDCFEIWVLHEFGLKESWNKIYNIGPTPHIGDGLYPTGFSMNGNFVLLKTSSSSYCTDELYLYNFGTQKATLESYTPIHDPNPRYLNYFLHYNESLISLRS